MNHASSAYGLWMLVILNSAVFIIFAFSFFKPQTRRDWRSFGAFSAFIVALFVEMYGFPLTVFLLSGWLQTREPGLDPLSHDTGHLWNSIFGIRGNPHFTLLHILSNLLLLVGFWILAAAWPVLLRAQRAGNLATSGVYARMRHPQYTGFILIMVGFLLQWPTLLTILMFPLLVTMYVRLAISEEREVEHQFGQAWRVYAARTPRFIPRFGGVTRAEAG